MHKLNTRIQSKHDTEANWALAENFKPLAGEVIVYDVDSNHAYPRFKVGDGKTLVSALPFSTDVLDKYVTLDTTQTITGAKTFSQQVIVPETPTANTHASSKGYVDTTVTGAVNGTREQLEKEIELLTNSVNDMQSNITSVPIQMQDGTQLGTVYGPTGTTQINIPTIAGPVGPTGADGYSVFAFKGAVLSNISQIEGAKIGDIIIYMGPESSTYSPEPGMGGTILGLSGYPGDVFRITGETSCEKVGKIIGPTGATGPTGANGKDGSDGAPGATGPTGVGITGVTFEETGTTTNGDVIPMPTTNDSGKYLSVNASGNYQLSTLPSNTYTLPVATSTTLGGVKPTTKLSSMTQSVGVDSSGRLWTEPADTSSSTSSLYKHIITMYADIDGGTTYDNQYLVIEFLDSRSSITFSDFINLLLNIGETSKQSYIYSNYGPGVYPIFKDCYILDYTNLSGNGSSYDGITPSTLTVMDADSEDISTMDCVLYVKSLNGSTTYEISFNVQNVIESILPVSTTSVYEDIAILIQ